mmetsp:Transcript_47835/g.97786  ORF Transcript_47835/g.97786 Transcript_47835/m.97786 type:complete len:489 (+) Transcript_47835:71-1537(+)
MSLEKSTKKSCRSRTCNQQRRSMAALAIVSCFAFVCEEVTGFHTASLGLRSTTTRPLLSSRFSGLKLRSTNLCTPSASQHNGLSAGLKSHRNRSPRAKFPCMSSVDTKAEQTATSDVVGEVGFEGFHSLEYWVGNAKQAASFFVARFGFEEVAFRGLETGSRDVVTHVVQQGAIRFAFSSALNPDNKEMGAHLQLHGDGVRDVSFKVKDCRKVYKMAIANGAVSISEPAEISDEFGTVVRATVATYGDTVHTFIQDSDYSGCYLPGFKAVTETDPLSLITPSPKLAFIDHVVANQPEMTMEEVCDWYSSVLGFRRFWSVDDSQVTTEYSSLRSIVMTDPAETVKLPINEPAPGKRKSQIQEYVDYYGGPGVQHIALRTHEILHTVQMLKDRGVKFLKVPDSYYDDLEVRLADKGVEVLESLAEIRRLNILVDFDEGGYLLQIFVQPLQDRPTVFIEVIQRREFEGFGVGNFKALFEAIEREQEARGNL